MRLLCVSHSADRMGAELALLSVVREAVRGRGHEVTVLVPRDGPLVADLAAAGAEVAVLPTRLWMGHRYNPVVGLVRLVQAAASVPAYRRYLAATRPDVVLTNSVTVPAGAVAARSLGVRHVWSVHESLLTNPSLRSVVPRRTIARVVAQLADGLVVPSAYVAAQLVAAAPVARGKVRVIPPPIDLPPARPSSPREDPPRLRRLVLLGRFTREKGQADAIAALAACRHNGYPLRLRLAPVRDARARHLLAAHADRYGVGDLVELTGWTDHPHTLYAWADATLMLSRNEAYGRVTVESLWSGTPVIGYRAGATTELLEPGGGILVEPTVDALAEALTALAADDTSYRRLQAAALRRAGQLGDLRSPAAVLLAHLEELLAAAR